MTVTLDNPGAVDLAVRQNSFEAAALAWFKAKRDKEHKRAVAFISASGTVAERNAIADRETAMVGKEEEALYEATRAVVRTLEVRASIGQIVAPESRTGVMSAEAFQEKLNELRESTAPLPLNGWDANLMALELRKRHMAYSAIATVMELYHGCRLTERAWQARLSRTGVSKRTARS